MTTSKDASAYWKQKLQDASLRVDLPTDHARSVLRGFQPESHPVSFPTELSKDLDALCGNENVPLSHLVLAGFMTLLHRYTTQEKFVVGSSLFGEERTSLHAGSLLCADFSRMPRFRDLLKQVHQDIASAYEYGGLPADILMEEIRKELSLEGVRESNVLFRFQDEAAGLQASPTWMTAGRSMNDPPESPDIALNLHKYGEKIQGALEYNAALFERSTIGRMMSHFVNILRSVVSQPDGSIDSLPLLAPSERQELLVSFNNNKRGYPENSTLVQLFETQVEKTPDALALVYENESLTYRQLNQQANQLGRYLQKLGVGPEVCVAICLDRSLDMIVSILGILKAGGAYVPLDPEYPEERLEFMLADTNALVLITKESFPVRHRQKNTTLLLDLDRPAISSMADGNPIGASNARSLAYIIYTSGSTGKPKGVCCVHQGVVNLLTDFENRQPVSGGGMCSWWTSVGFDVSVYEIFSALLYGRALLIVPQNIRTDSRRFFEYLQQHDARSAYVTPSQLNDLANWLETSGQISMERLLVGVEPINEQLLARISLAMPGVKIINGYGPTEATICSTLFDFDPSRAQDRNTPIGRAVQNTQIYLLDPQGQPVPIGVAGELYIGGDGLARGYLNQPDATAKKFVPNPFGDAAGALMYRTGDLARFLPDGTIMFVGRFDAQVKLHGYRIELGEIEAAFCQHPAVQDILVVAHEYLPGDKRLVAYIVPKDGKQPTGREWRQFLRRKIPNYMVPTVFMTVDGLPLNPNGKIDRKALPTPAFDRTALENDFFAPRNATEKTIARIWAEIFSLDEVGIHDNFFDLGGDSILSIQIASRTNQAGIYLGPNQVFEHPTIAQLASIAESVPDLQTEQGSVTGELPMTPVQRWFFENEFAEAHHWNQAFLIKVQASLDPALLEKALQILLVHHDALRLRFRMTESGWQQRMSPDVETIALSQHDLSYMEEADQKAMIQSTAAELQARLDLSEGPLMIAALFDLGPQKEGYLFITIHHLVVDGVSWRILLDHLSLVYEQLHHNNPVHLPSKTTSYKQWAQRLVQYAQSDDLKRELTYWLDRRSDPLVHLPVDGPPGKDWNIEQSARTVSASLSVEDTEKLLRDVPKAYQTQINDVLLTALMQVFSRWTGRPTLLINLEGHGREPIFGDVDLLRTVGWFTTIFPVALSLEEASGTGERLKSMKEQLRQIPNRGIGHGLLRHLCDEREIVEQLKALPEAEISFNYLGQFDQLHSSSAVFKLTNEPCGPEHSLKASRHHLLDITGMIIDGRLQLDWRYSANVHQRMTIETLAQGFIDALQTIISHCQSPTAGGYTPSDFPEANLSQQELDDLMNEIRELEGED